MTTINYRFDQKTKEYLSSSPAQLDKKGNPVPALLTTTVKPPVIPEKMQAVWNGNSWDLVEDHRQKPDGRGGKKDGTPYWLPEDEFGTPARYMTELGPLPENAIFTEPEKSEEMIKEEKRQEILGRLSAIDQESLRPLRAIAQGTATDYDTSKLASLEAEAVTLRAELATL